MNRNWTIRFALPSMGRQSDSGIPCLFINECWKQTLKFRWCIHWVLLAWHFMVIAGSRIVYFSYRWIESRAFEKCTCTTYVHWHRWWRRKMHIEFAWMVVLIHTSTQSTKGLFRLLSSNDHPLHLQHQRELAVPKLKCTNMKRHWK